MSPGVEASKLYRGDDLLPIDPKEVASYLLDDGQVVADTVQGMVTVLNYLCAVAMRPFLKLPDRPLTKPQERVGDHLRKAVSYLEESGQGVRSFEETTVPLGEATMGSPSWSWKTSKLTWWSLLGMRWGRRQCRIPLTLCRWPSSRSWRIPGLACCRFMNGLTLRRCAPVMRSAQGGQGRVCPRADPQLRWRMSLWTVVDARSWMGRAA